MNIDKVFSFFCPYQLAWMRDAAGAHLGFLKNLDRQDIVRILDFERRIYAAQQIDAKGGPLDGDGAMGGAKTLQVSLAGRLGKDRSFAITLLVGIAVLFAGFLVSPSSTRARVRHADYGTEARPAVNRALGEAAFR